MPSNALDDYQAFTKTVAVYPEVGTHGAFAVMYCTLGVAGEAGEFADKVKKIVRAGGIAALTKLGDEDRAKLLGELGDVLWYVARAADELGAPLSGIARSNQEKLLSRQQRGVLKGEGDNR